MKTNIFCFAFMVGLLACGVRSGVAQQLSLSSPIIVQLSEIDRYGVHVVPLNRVTRDAEVLMPYRNMKEHEVNQLVKNGMILNRPVWIMDGDKAIARCKLDAEFRLDSEVKSEYGLCVGFSSDQEAQKVGAKLKLVPSLDELIQRQKAHLDDERTWIF